MILGLPVGLLGGLPLGLFVADWYLKDYGRKIAKMFLAFIFC